MVAQYGPGILASPGTRGFAITAWLVPVAGVLAAALAIVPMIVLGRRRRQAHEAAAAIRRPSAVEDAYLDEVLNAFNSSR